MKTERDLTHSRKNTIFNPFLGEILHTGWATDVQKPVGVGKLFFNFNLPAAPGAIRTVTSTDMLHKII